MTKPQKHQKLYDWLVEQPIGCEAHQASATAVHNRSAVEALKELTSMILCSTNNDISAFLDSARAAIREKATADNIDLPSHEQDIPCTD